MDDGTSSAPNGKALPRALRSAVGREATTFGFSILVTVTFGLAQSAEGPPSTAQSFLFALGAVMSFTLLQAILSRGFRRRMPQHATQTLTLGTSLNALSVVAGLGAAWGWAEATSGWVAWAGSPLVAGLVYLLLESLEEAVAERVLVASGDADAERVSNQDS